MVLALGQHGHDMETIPVGDHHVPEELRGEKLLQLAFQVDNEDDCETRTSGSSTRASRSSSRWITARPGACT